ncbi:hypothetical protein C9975_07950 [Thalassospira xiamenensis]|nr:hypothetical protein C9975_07950 [Thalassospira xiamenensis]
MAANEKNDFKVLQKRFANHLRAPELSQFSNGIEARRLQVYRDLIRNNLRSFLDSAFPVTAKALGPNEWQQLQADFQAAYHCTSPYFTAISEAFVDYIQNLSNAQCQAYPYIKELVQYERVEVDVALAQKPDTTMRLAATDIDEASLMLNPTARVLSYQYAVHQVSDTYQPQTPSDESIQLVVYKNTQDKVRFVALNPITAMLLNHLQQQGALFYEALVTLMQRALPDLPETQIQAGLTQTLQAFCSNELVLQKAL